MKLIISVRLICMKLTTSPRPNCTFLASEKHTSDVIVPFVGVEIKCDTSAVAVSVARQARYIDPSNIGLLAGPLKLVSSTFLRLIPNF